VYQWASQGEKPNQSFQAAALFHKAQSLLGRGDNDQAIALFRQVRRSHLREKAEAELKKLGVELEEPQAEEREAPPTPPPAEAETPPAPAKQPRPAPDHACGPEALAVVCEKLGVKTSVAERRELINQPGKPASMYDLAKAARAKGLKAVGLRLDLEEFQREKPPFIALIRQHFAAVVGHDQKAVHLIGEEGKEAAMAWEELEKAWSGFVLVVTKPR